VMLKAINGEITWIQAAEILGATARHMRRMRNAVKHEGFGELIDGRGTRIARRLRIPLEVIHELCRLKREVYPDFSLRHFYEKVTEKHGLELSYNWARLVLQEARRTVPTSAVPTPPSIVARMTEELSALIAAKRARSEPLTVVPMMNCKVVALWLAVATLAYAGTPRLQSYQAQNHLGESATVCGVVASAKYAESSHRAPTFLNLDRAYPQQLFTIVIWGADRAKFGTPEVTYSGNVCASRAPSKSIAASPRSSRPTPRRSAPSRC
jgi:hypothetical protein